VDTALGEDQGTGMNLSGLQAHTGHNVSTLNRCREGLVNEMNARFEPERRDPRRTPVVAHVAIDIYTVPASLERDTRGMEAFDSGLLCKGVEKS